MMRIFLLFAVVCTHQAVGTLVDDYAGTWFVSLTKINPQQGSQKGVTSETINATLNLTKSDKGASGSLATVGDEHKWTVVLAPLTPETYHFTIQSEGEGGEGSWDLDLDVTLQPQATATAQVVAHFGAGGVLTGITSNTWTLVVPKGRSSFLLSAHRTDKPELAWWQRSSFLVSCMVLMVVFRGYTSYQKEKTKLQAVRSRQAAAQAAKKTK
eukprot:PhF_6_TR10188/c0_g1_i1/m.15799